jgi:hypothetical protein
MTALWSGRALFTLAIATFIGCGDGPKSVLRPTPTPSGSPNDEFYKEQRAKRQDYSESSSISACSVDSGNCYSLVADINHHFDGEGKEMVTVEQVHFENGGYLVFGSAPIPGGGTDQHGKDWSFGW